MASLREGILRAELEDTPWISAQAVAGVFALSQPVSIRHLTELLAPDQVAWDTKPIGSDDNIVQARGQLKLTSTGWWSFRGHVKDNGHGAKFIFAITPKHADKSGHQPIFQDQLELKDDEDHNIHQDGRDLWICRNWDGIKSKGFHYSLKASWSSNFGQILALVLLGLAVAVGFFFASTSKHKGTWVTKPDGSRGYEIPVGDQPPDP